MSIDFEKARQLAESYYNSMYFGEDDKLVILDEETIHKEYGWYFFSQSEKYLQTENISDMVLGNGMILVKKEDGEIIQFGTAYDEEHYIAKYEREN